MVSNFTAAGGDIPIATRIHFNIQASAHEVRNIDIFMITSQL